MINLDAVEGLSEAAAKEVLTDIFTQVTQPAFGILPQRELDLMLFRALRKSGVIARDATLYELMSQLKITRAKARNLLFDLEMREASESGGDLDARAKEALSNPRGFVQDGAYLVFGVENPVVQAHLKEKVNALGHLTDASFDSSLVRIKPAALPALIEELMSDDDQRAFREAMIDAGFEKDDTLTAALTESLKHLSKKYLGEATTEIAGGYIEQLSNMMMPRAQKAKNALSDMLKDVFKARTDAGPKVR